MARRSAAPSATPLLPGMSRGGAEFSADRRYRWKLWRWLTGNGPSRWGPVMFLMLNPSTADETDPDRTVARCTVFASDWGGTELWVANLFGYVSTDPLALLALQSDRAAVGPDNDRAILEIADRVMAGVKPGTIVCAWGDAKGKGAKALVRRRVGAVVPMLRDRGYPLYHLGLTAAGNPRHPLYLPKSLRPTLWPPTADKEIIDEET